MFLPRRAERPMRQAVSRWRRVRNEDGGALIEFAVTVPVLLLLVTGILVFGLSLSNYLMLTQATAVGARQLAVSRGQTLDPCNTVVTAVYAAAPLLKQSSLTFSFVSTAPPTRTQPPALALSPRDLRRILCSEQKQR